MFYFNIRYLETENLEHCVPSSVSSGLAKLPLSHVFVNGKQTAETTTKQLPDGEPLNGKKAYQSIMSYFTTISKTPDEVHQLGKDMLKKLYPEVNLIPCYKMPQGDLPYKMDGGGARRKFSQEPLRNTKILPCGRGLNVFHP